ncbi:MAG: UbiD family decarboxylase [Deltaproteobacteria bacterium]|nr:UbiD family decarboxylase [Deltaproteobacteria bacterium]
MVRDLRDWIAGAEAIGQLRRVRGADWRLEIGTLSELNYKRRNHPALLFEAIKDYPPGYRVLTGSISNAARVAYSLGLPPTLSDAGLVQRLRGKPLEWERRAAEFPPRYVPSGPVEEHLDKGNEIDLLKFPAPFWHEHDGGRYLGTGCLVITRDPDSDWVNFGSYRGMVQDRSSLTVLIIPGKHGRLHIEKYHARGEPAPVAISLGHDPLLFLLAGIEVPPGVSEFSYAGAIRGEPVEVVRGKITGLPVPAASEIVLEGWMRPGSRKLEGPFGEWPGYYSGTNEPVQVLDVELVQHRSDPILLGAPPSRPPHDYSYSKCLLRSAMLHDVLEKAGVPEVRGVWFDEVGGGRLFVTVAIKQRYPGHARQAAFVASQCHIGAYMGRYVIVVDDDIDPTNLQEVMWAVCTRSDPEKDIDILRRTWGSKADPLLRDPKAAFNSRAIIDACRPYEHLDEFPRVAQASPEETKRVRDKWKELLE